MKTHHHLLSLVAIVCCACFAHAETNRIEANRLIEIEFRSETQYKNPFTEVEFDAIVTQPNGKQLRIPGFWAGGDRWCFRYASNQIGKHTWRTECTEVKNAKLNGAKGDITVVKYDGDNPLYRHGPTRVTKNKRHFEHADGTPFFWLGDTWWKGLCKRLTWEGFQELTADRKKKGFTIVQIVCGTYPDELGLLKPSWENEGGMPYLKKDFSVVNPKYFEYADRRFEHLIDNGITPAIVGGWGRAVGLNAVGLPGYKRHFRNLIARYGAYPVIWILGGETQKKQGPWYELAEYVVAIDPYDRLLTNHSSHLRHAFDDFAAFDFDMDATGHRSWQTANSAIDKARKALATSPIKPYVSGESCYEQHMQENFADLQRHQFWGLMLSGAAGHTYGAAGIWHMGVAEEHGNWGGWKHQPYDLTTWREGMHFQGSKQLGLSKALLEKYPWQRFEPHPEWVDKECFAAGIPGELRFIYQPKRGVYKWDGITVKNLKPGTWSAFYFDPASGQRFDLGVVQASGTWKSPNVPSPRDWVLVMQAQKTGASITRPDVKVGQSLVSPANTRAETPRPNVLMICIDDLNDWVGFLGGHPEAITPHMDSLAKRGRIFANAHCAVPVCSASRASVMSGVAATTHGSYELGPRYEQLPALTNVPTIQRYFKDNGFYTLSGGKVLHHGFGGRLAGDIHRSLGRKRSPRPKKPMNRPSNWSGAWDWGAYPANDADMADFQLAKNAAKALQEDFDKPFFMSVGFFRPHVPLFVPPKWFDLYDAEKITLPKNPKSDLDDLPKNFLSINDYAAAPTHAEVIKHDKQRSLTHAYLASISFVDHCVGIVLDALQSSSYADNTIIVLWSDHGFHLGEKQHWAKRTLWEESTRVPLLFAGPGIKPGNSCAEPASLIDIYPTLVELCKLPKNSQLKGVSLVPQLNDPATPRDQPAITSSYFGNHSIRSRDWRLIVYKDRAEELYDHRNDPDEFHNLASDPGRKAIRDQLARWLPNKAAPEFKAKSERSPARAK